MSENLITFDEVVSIYSRLMTGPCLLDAVWYTTFPKLKRLCRMYGLSAKKSGRLIKKVANGRMTVNQVNDYLMGLPK